MAWVQHPLLTSFGIRHTCGTDIQSSKTPIHIKKLIIKKYIIWKVMLHFCDKIFLFKQHLFSFPKKLITE